MNARRKQPGRLEPATRQDTVFLHLAAIFGLFLVFGWGWTATAAERVILVPAFWCGVWIVVAIARLPWAEDRARWIQTISVIYLPLYVLFAAFHLEALSAVLVGSYAGLIEALFVRAIRSGRLKLLGIWPEDPVDTN